MQRYNIFSIPTRSLEKRLLKRRNNNCGNTSPKCLQTLCHSGFRMVRCSPNISPHISPHTSPSGSPSLPPQTGESPSSRIGGDPVQPNLKFGCSETGISNSHFLLRANFKFTRTRGNVGGGGFGGVFGGVSGEVSGEVIKQHLTIRKPDKHWDSKPFGEVSAHFSCKTLQRPSCADRDGL